MENFKNERNKIVTFSGYSFAGLIILIMFSIPVFIFSVCGASLKDMLKFFENNKSLSAGCIAFSSLFSFSFFSVFPFLSTLKNSKRYSKQIEEKYKSDDLYNEKEQKELEKDKQKQEKIKRIRWNKRKEMIRKAFSDPFIERYDNFDAEYDVVQKKYAVGRKRILKFFKIYKFVVWVSYSYILEWTIIFLISNNSGLSICILIFSIMFILIFIVCLENELLEWFFNIFSRIVIFNEGKEIEKVKEKEANKMAEELKKTKVNIIKVGSVKENKVQISNERKILEILIKYAKKNNFEYFVHEKISARIIPDIIIEEENVITIFEIKHTNNIRSVTFATAFLKMAEKQIKLKSRFNGKQVIKCLITGSDIENANIQKVLEYNGVVRKNIINYI